MGYPYCRSPTKGPFSDLQLELGWGICTLATYRVNSYKSLYALRFLVGLFESGFYPGIHYLLGGWYTPREIGKRAMIFWLSGSIGQMFSGFLQAAAYNNLSGVGGLSGWRWLFIVDAIITIPIALFGFIFLPGLPLQDKKEWWLTEEENDLAISRLNHIGRAGRTPWSWAKVRRLFSTWHIYVLREPHRASLYLNVSLPLCHLEQWLSPAANGLLPEGEPMCLPCANLSELQHQALPSSWSPLHGFAN